MFCLSLFQYPCVLNGRTVNHAYLNTHLQWALNFALPEQDTLIFVCTCHTNDIFSCGSHHSVTVSFLAIIPLAKVCSVCLQRNMP